MEISRVADLSLSAPMPETRKVEAAAEEFEAILLGQMLKSVRESSEGGWLAPEEDQASSPAVEFAEQQVAKTLAQSGGLGLARLLSKQLAAQPANE